MIINNKNSIPVLLITGVVAGLLIRLLFTTTLREAIWPSELNIQPLQTKEIRAGGYEFINPLLECDNFNPVRSGTLITLEAELKDYIAHALATNKARHVSVYFRDLNNGPWIGINEDEKYAPASLLKVPLAIAAMKKAEQDPYFLQQVINYDKSLATTRALPNMNDTIYLKKGKSYTIEELVKHMVADSDNEAMMLVLNNTGEGLTNKVMNDLGIRKMTDKNANDFVSVRQYSSMFRLLFNATYLTKDKSDQLLGIMSQSKYTKGLEAGLPPGIRVSHKFGERGFDNSNTRQLHDCGIVYYPGAPYLLCVMTRGEDFNDLTSVIAGISGIVYAKKSMVKE